MGCVERAGTAVLQPGDRGWCPEEPESAEELAASRARGPLGRVRHSQKTDTRAWLQVRAGLQPPERLLPVFWWVEGGGGLGTGGGEGVGARPLCQAPSDPAVALPLQEPCL